MSILSKQADNKLIELYVSGNNAAFKELLYRHKDVLYRYILYLVKDSSLAEDFFQDTFIRAIVLIKEGEYSEQGYFRTWLCRIAHNMVIDYFRKNKQNQLIAASSYAGIPFELLQNNISEDNIQNSIIEQDQMRELKYLLTLLPAEQREVVFLRYYNDMSFKEIAEHLGISINTALGRMRYAILNIRKMAHQKSILF